MENNKISVILPVYGTEQYVKRCFNSLHNQSYRNLEFIVVNDCSTGNIEEIVKEYQRKDKRFRYILHEKNRGLFQARVTGMKEATGDYIAFLDSDDYVSMDYYRVLLNKALEKKADLVIGKTVHETLNGERYVYNLHDAALTFEVLEGDEIREAFFGQEYNCYAWHTVWNKLYHKDLIKQCLSYFERLTQHVIMTEDVAFSSIFMYYAKKAVTVENEAYFYCINPGASTDVNRISIKKLEKNIVDISTVFDFVKEFLIEKQASMEILAHVDEGRKLYARIWNNVKNHFDDLEQEEVEGFLQKLYPGYQENMLSSDQYFQSIKTPWSGGLEYNKVLMTEEKYEYVSFDIFDTLVKRPFYTPTDAFDLLQKKFNELFKTSIMFKTLRIEAERGCREEFGHFYPGYQDVTLTEIYEYMSKKYMIPKKIATEMQKAEEELEIELCTIRNAGKELYDCAKARGKKIIIVSDMYLEEDIILRILERNGYCGYERLFLSSKERLTKNTGDLFKLVLKEIDVKPDKVIHIGDTWHSDIEMTKLVDMDSIFLPKYIDVFNGVIESTKTNNCCKVYKLSGNELLDSDKILASLGYRTMIATIASKYFDNPFRAFNELSDFNIDPYFIGLYPVAMHLMGLVKWIGENSKDRDAVQFMSRDGYLPMLAYEEYRKIVKDLPVAKYLYTSRKAFLPWMILTKTDLYDLPVEFRNHTPKTILKMCSFCCKDVNEQEISDALLKHGFIYEKAFASKKEFDLFIDYFIQELFSHENLECAKENVRKYVGSAIKGNDIAFDMGYSGRIQAAVCNALERPMDVFFIHCDEKRSNVNAYKNHYEMKSFYDFTPKISGLLREHILSENSGSCIGFKEENGQMKAIFDDTKKLYTDIFVTESIKRGALDFIREYCSIFKDYIDILPFKEYEVSLPFEAFITMSSEADMKVLSESYFEDMVYGAKKNIGIYQYIMEERALRVSNNESIYASCVSGISLDARLKGKNKLIKFIVYYNLDRETLRVRMWSKLQGHKLLFKMTRDIYRRFLSK